MLIHCASVLWCCFAVWAFYLPWTLALYKIRALQKFSVIPQVTFSPHWLFPLRWHFFTNDVILFDFICFCWLSFWFHIQEIIGKSNVIKLPLCLFFQKIYIHRFMHKIFYLFWVKICMWCYVRVQIHSLTSILKYPLFLDT